MSQETEIRIMNKGVRIKTKKQGGFTLVELLIVISIIGVLSALLMANFIGVRQRARDSQRKSDLRQIQSALELYKSDSSSSTYPSAVPNATCSNSRVLIADSADCNSTIYMKRVPLDPMGTSYYYSYSASTDTYILASCLENSSDKGSDVFSDTTTPKSTDIDPSIKTNLVCASLTYYILQNP